MSDVIGALISEIKERMKIKYNSSDPLTLTQRTAEWAITIQEAVLKRDGTIYPVGDLNERVTQINSNPKFRDELAIGDIVLKGGAPIFSPNTDMNPVLEFPHKDNKREGAICIYKMPVKDSNGVVMRGRFIGACLTPGEKVMTSSGLKNVEDITYNDRLINKDGEIVDINKLLIHDVVDEDVYRLKLSNTFRTTQFTKDHPILSSKIKTRYTNYKKANRLGVSERYYEFDFQFNKINDIGIGDYIKVPNIYKKVDDNILHYWEEGQLLYRTDRRISNPLLLEDFWWFVGLWLGDGWCASNGYKISVAFNKKETIYIERFKKIVTELFKRKYEVTDKQENSLEIHFCFQELNSFLTKHFGKYADGKQIPEWAKYINHDLKKQLLLGYLNSDGCVIINKQSKAVIEFVSINLTLLESFQDILFSLGLISSVKLLRPAKQRMIVGKIRKTKPCYSLLMSFHDTIKFYNFFPDYLDHKLNKVIASTQIRRKPMTDCILDKNGDYILFKITGKEHSTYTGKVYNFECKTHTFMCHHITTHNCDPYDDDSSETLSLGALYILDLYTDELVAEYVGRPMFAEEFYENCRKLLLFYNAECNYENNKKGLFKHFSQYNSLYLLSPTLDFLKEKQLMKEGLYGNKSYGTIATEPIKTYARRAIRDWLLKPRDIINVVPTEDGRQVEEVTTIRNLYTIPFKALCQELAL